MCSSPTSLTAMDAEHDASEHVIVQPSVRGRCPTEWIDRRKGDRQFCLNDRPCQLSELTWAAFSVVSTDAELPPRRRLRLDAVGMRDPAAITQKIEASLELVAAGQREHGIDAARGQLSKAVGDVAAPRVDHGIGAEAPDESGGAASGRGAQHSRAMPLRELHRECADCSGGAEDENGFALPDLEHAIDTLVRRQAGHRAGGGLQVVETVGHTGRLALVDRDVLRVETTGRIFSVVRVRAIPDAKTPDAHALRHHAPAPSVPSTIGNLVRPAGRHDPSRIDSSQLPTPAAWSAITIWRGPGCGIGKVWIVMTEGGPKRSIAAALIDAGNIGRAVMTLQELHDHPVAR